MPLLSCFRGKAALELVEPPKPPCSSKQRCDPQQAHLVEVYGSKDSTYQAPRGAAAVALIADSSNGDSGRPWVNGALINLIHLLATLDGGWWSALSEACQATCEQLGADHSCVYVLNSADLWATTAACAGLGASWAAGRAYSADPRFNGSAAAVMMRLQKDAPSQSLVFRSAPRTSSRGSGNTSEGQPAADELPGDWQVLREEYGMQHFAAVGLMSAAGEPVGVLSLAAKAGSRPASWSPEALHCVVGLLASHIRRAQAVLASSAMSQLHAAATFSDMVNAAAEAALDAAAAVAYVRGQSRVAFIRADIGAAAIFQQQQSDGDSPNGMTPLLRARRSSCEFVTLPTAARKSVSTFTASRLSIDLSSVNAGRTVTATDGLKRESWTPRQTAAALPSFTLPFPKGTSCKGHTLTLHKTLLGEALSKQVAGLCIDDCQAYTVTIKAYPRDLLLSRGAVMPMSLALATISDQGKPLLALYVTFGSTLAGPLLQAVVQELQQLLQAMLPVMKAKLGGQLQPEYDYLGTQLERAISRKAGHQRGSTAHPLANATSDEQLSDPPSTTAADSDPTDPREGTRMLSFILQEAPAAATAAAAAAAGATAAGPVAFRRPSALYARTATGPGQQPADPCSSCEPTTPTATAAQQHVVHTPTPTLSGSQHGAVLNVATLLLRGQTGGQGTGGSSVGRGQDEVEEGPDAFEGDLEMGHGARVAFASQAARGGVRAQSACEAGTDPTRRLLARLAVRSVSFRLEAARAPRGASKLAPIIASMHDRLKAAQAVQMTIGRTEARQADLRSLKLLQEIGQGGYGTVYRGTYHGAEVAVKVIKQSKLAAAVHSSSNAMCSSHGLGLHKHNLHDAIELVASVSMSHTNIVQVPAYFMDVRLDKPEEANPLDSADQPTESKPFRLTHSPSLLESPAPGQDAQNHGDGAMALVLEFCDCGSLCDAIMSRTFIEKVVPKKAPGTSLTKTYLAINMRSVYLTLLEIALALRHMHGLALVHCDLKPQNVLLKSSPRDPRGFTAKLSDFGLAKMMAHDDDGQLVIDEAVASGTITHVAPEVLLGQAALGAAVDIYAFGVLMFQVLCGMKVYDKKMSATAIANAVAHSAMRPQLPGWVPSSYRALAQACWAAEPSARPTADELVRHLEGAIEAKRGTSGAGRPHSRA